jgi:hypothetical protein
MSEYFKVLRNNPPNEESVERVVGKIGMDDPFLMLPAEARDPALTIWACWSFAKGLENDPFPIAIFIARWIDNFGVPVSIVTEAINRCLAPDAMAEFVPTGRETYAFDVISALWVAVIRLSMAAEAEEVIAAYKSAHHRSIN